MDQPKEWVRVAAKDLNPGMRFWEPDGHHDTFLRREEGRAGSRSRGTDVKRVVFSGGLSGRECSLVVETWEATFRVVASDC